MEEGRIKELLSEGAVIYDNSQLNLSDVENWVNSKTDEEYRVANLFYKSVQTRNQRPSTFLWGKINPSLEKEIFKEISNHISLQQV